MRICDWRSDVFSSDLHCTCRELYKGVVDGQGRGIFDGQILVHAGAFKTDASLTNKNLLLSMWAQAYTRPQLKIFADDVKCSHGATVSQPDERSEESSVGK